MSRLFRLYVAVIFFYLASLPLIGRAQEDTIEATETARILGWLSDDQRRGRVNFTVSQLEAAAFIAGHFQRLGLKIFPGLDDYYHRFAPSAEALPVPLTEREILWNRRRLPYGQVHINPGFPIPAEMGIRDFALRDITLADSLEWILEMPAQAGPLLFWIRTDESLAARVPDTLLQILDAKSEMVVVVADPERPTDLKLKANPLYVENVLHNVVAVLPGTTQAHEAVIFSAHYDHIGIDVRSGRKGLYNGANDNASGTTAVLQLARYYAMRGPQPRTLIFACFAGEELGLLGSEAFVRRIIPENIVANINIEMIGMHNVTGRNAFFLTGEERSSLMDVMRRNLGRTGFRVDPAPSGNFGLFERSDNFRFYEKGIVAHSVMCSDDGEPCYHLNCDDYRRIDLENMNRVIIAIARSVSSIVQGWEKPVRR